MQKHIIDISPKGYEVYVDLIYSRAGHYMSRQPYVIGLVKEVLKGRRLAGSPISIEQDMGRVIGKTDIVETSEQDTIFYAQPPKSTVFSRYVKNHYPSPSRKLTILLEKDPEGNYQVLDTWIGPVHPPFPGDKYETEQSKLYWSDHALVKDAQIIQSKTITKTCPY